MTYTAKYVFPHVPVLAGGIIMDQENKAVYTIKDSTEYEKNQKRECKMSREKVLQ